ncbi:MAG: phosphoribosylanthranilate isomerase [Gammaproteobacteria bacterium]|nr:phosphoribosylanthranilate isomerase [Gammaproteobacteria bacterium]
MTRIKICGITNCEDAKYAYDSGADAIGLVFYPPSPRYISVEQALEIVHSLPPFITTVALFVNEKRQVIDSILKQININLLQFHGNESEQFCASFNCPYIKAVRMKEGLDLYHVQNEYSSAKGLLLDTYKKGIPGGTGEAFNWHKVPHDLTLPVILAGGLVADNIAQAIIQVKPYAVDVSGGVEATHIQKKGKKDPQKITQFMTQAKQAY